MLAALRAKYPGCELHVPMPLEQALFAQALKLIDSSVYNPKVQYDVVISPRPTPIHAPQIINTALTGTVPVSEQRVKAIDGSATGPFAPVISVPKVQGCEGFVAIHPSGSFGKVWPLHKWIKLAKALVAAGHKLFIICGPKDFDLGPRVSKTLPKESVVECFYQPLTHVAGLLANCTALIGAEDGITHLAAALGIPGVATWNPVYSHWQPVGARFQYIPLESSPETVLEAFSRV